MEQYRQFIVSDPKVMMGKPTIAGTRITVEFILESLAAGETPEQLLEEHPRLKREDIQAALAIAPVLTIPQKNLILSLGGGGENN